LATFPELGAIVPETGENSIRELIEHPYRIIYRVSADEVEVLAVIHSARQLPPNLGPSEGSS
jgi:toxin ParE1/3/4